MNLALSDEQEFLREAARGALSRVKTIEAAREALEGSRAARPVADRGRGRLARAADRRGPRRRRARAPSTRCSWRRSAAACWRARRCWGCCRPAGCCRPPATKPLEAVAAGELRPAWLPARPPGDLVEGWTVEPRAAASTPARAARDGRRRPRELHWRGRVGPRCCPGADLLVVVGRRRARRRGRGRRRGERGEIEAVTRYDATRSLGHVTFDGARRPAPAGHRRAAARGRGTWPRRCWPPSRWARWRPRWRWPSQYAKERFTFGRAIGSYQAIKHGLTEVLRRQENARSLLYYAGWACEDQPEEFALAASAARSAAGSALDFAAAPEHRHPRRDRRDLGARRAAVLPPRPALPAAAGRSGRRHRPRGGGAARGGLTRRAPSARLALDLVRRRAGEQRTRILSRGGQPASSAARRAQPRHVARAPQRRERQGLDRPRGRSRHPALGRGAGAPPARGGARTRIEGLYPDAERRRQSAVNPG